MNDELAKAVAELNAAEYRVQEAIRATYPAGTIIQLRTAKMSIRCEVIDGKHLGHRIRLRNLVTGSIRIVCPYSKLSSIQIIKQKGDK